MPFPHGPCRFGAACDKARVNVISTAANTAITMSTFDYAAARTAMIESQLRPSGVRDVPVLRAFATTPRELFLPLERRFLAYSDEQVEIAPAKSGKPARHLMQPVILARLIQQAAVKPTDRVLNVACGTGYPAALLAQLAGTVVAVEEDGELAASARKILRELGHDNVTVIEGPLTEGAPEQAPFDMILVSGGIEVEPGRLFAQLKDGGRLFAVFGPERDGDAVVFTKAGSSVSKRPLFDAGACVLPGFEARPAFVF